MQRLHEGLIPKHSFYIFVFSLFFVFGVLFAGSVCAQSGEQKAAESPAPAAANETQAAASENNPSAPAGAMGNALTEPVPQTGTAEAEVKTVLAPAEAKNATDKSAYITLDFKDADIRSVLKIIALKAGINIVASPEVTGTVTIYLDEVPWEEALEVILKTYNFGYEKKANVITVAPLDKLTAQKKQEQELAQVQPTVTDVFKLSFIDALDAKKAIEPLLSPRGKITVLEQTGKAGWSFGGEALGKKTREGGERKSLTKTLLITDIPPVMEQIKKVIKLVDVKPRQIMIETRIVEVSRNYLRDIGFEYATGTVASVTRNSINQYFDQSGYIKNGNAAGVTPSAFGPVEGATTLTPSTAGLQLALRKIVGDKFEVILNALEEDVHANLLSAPRIMTMDNQEATILVGTKYPILSTTSSQATTSLQTSLDYYQDIGIQLNVVPQITGEDKISMIIHPAVSTFSTTIGTTQVSYPVIQMREAETQVFMGDGETIVIGGLIKDNTNKEIIGTPFLSKIPLLGWFFRRDTHDTEKIELLIFITARIVNESGLTQSETSFLDQVAKDATKEAAPVAAIPETPVEAMPIQATPEPQATPEQK